VLLVEWKASADADLLEILNAISEQTSKPQNAFLIGFSTILSMRQSIPTFSSQASEYRACVKS
jgi:hypothetical protein